MRSNPLTVLVRFLSAHRRGVAALAAMLAVGALGVVASGRDQVLVQVVVAVDHVDAGRVLTEDDVTIRSVPSEFVPEEALTEIDKAVGRMAAATVPKGAIVTDMAFVTTSRHGASEGRLIMSVPLNPPELGAQLKAGDRVALLVSTGYNSATTTIDAIVVSLPETTDGGMFSSSTTTFLVDVAEADAGVLAGVTPTVALR
jgi:hypothetical protein